ncbi:hypothetical protein HPP92_021915 [Vanilla planifolia]|uniref:GPI inositol-deacylase n=1 Tax=Vanilla planifolia TaxID=51239 RepID=A0A835UHJ7_VANPL|nr:hypothetical protein HPP92_021915 [Vanilla planifolia]
MVGFLSKCRVGVLVAVSVLLGFTALYELLKPAPSGCVMTYMYPTYIPISAPANVSSDKYGLFLYYEGWKKINFDEHIKKLEGVPVLFIPGNGGSYKQVRSLAAESTRAYQGGPLERTFYHDASFFHVDGEIGILYEDSNVFKYPTQYKRMLDWFAVDLEGEHSAMDGGILEEHTEYVVYSIHKILNLYHESREAMLKDGAVAFGSLPTSVILVGHSMGGFVARAAVIHPHLRKSAVETILTLSSPHQAPPVALQPSLGYYFSEVNKEWRKGYAMQTGYADHTLSESTLSHVVVISISGGINDFQVRSKLASLNGIVPSSHGFMIGSSNMKNVWLSMEHQTILWCNQLVVQLSHTLLALINPENGQPFPSPQKRLLIFTKMLQSGLPQSLGWMKPEKLSLVSRSLPTEKVKDSAGSQMKGFSFCPPFHWTNEVLEKDLYIQSTSVTVLAMDGRRRWLDIKNLGSDGKGHFILVTNLAACSGVRIHLWPEKGKSASGDNLPLNPRILEVTSKMVEIPAGPAPRQIEPGSQTEQAPPSSMLMLRPEEMHGYRFLTISVAPRPTVSGRPPPAVSMAVGQFFNPKDGEREFSPSLLLRSVYSKEEILLKEDHPLFLNLSFAVSLGLLPITLSLRTEGCGLKDSAGNMDENSLCRLRCFPPVGLAWDSISGMRIIGFMVTAVFFALMRQASYWQMDLPLPSILTTVELNLRITRSFLLLVGLPLITSLILSFLTSHDPPPVLSYVTVSIACYLIANGSVVIVILASQLILYMVAMVHVFTKRRWQAWQENVCVKFLRQILEYSSAFYSLKIMQTLRSKITLVVAFITVPLVCFVHPALGLIVLLFYHAFHCYDALCSFLAASFRSNAQRREFIDPKPVGSSTVSWKPKANDACDPLLPLDDSNSSSPNSAKSFGESQLDVFNYKHGILILHLLVTLMFIPSLAAWLQRIGMGQSFPWFIDSALCVGVILHGLSGSRPDAFFLSIPFPFFQRFEFNLSMVYLFSGYYCFLCALASAPYKAFYAMASVGVISFLLRILPKRFREMGNSHCRSSRKHPHRH